MENLEVGHWSWYLHKPTSIGLAQLLVFGIQGTRKYNLYTDTPIANESHEEDPEEHSSPNPKSPILYKTSGKNYDTE